MQRVSTPATSSNRAATARGHGTDWRKAEGGGAGFLRGLRSHPWLVARRSSSPYPPSWAAVWREVADEVGNGPNVFMMARV